MPQRFAGMLEPAVDYLAVAVDELDELQAGRDLKEVTDALVPRPRRREGPRPVQLDDPGGHRPRQRGASVVGTRIDVDDREPPAREAQETEAKPLAFVPADHDDAGPAPWRGRRVHGRGRQPVRVQGGGRHDTAGS